MLKHPVTKTPLSLPPLLTRMGVYQQVINVSPPHHSLAPEWNVCPSFPDGQFSPSLYSMLRPRPLNLGFQNYLYKFHLSIKCHVS